MNPVTKFFKSFLYTLASVYFSIIFYYDACPVIIEVFKMINEENTFKETILICFTVFITLLIISVIIAFIIKAIYNIYLPIYYHMFYDEMREKIGITLDENNYINSCFVKLKSGKVIPIEISKMAIPKIYTESAEEKKLEENKNE